MKMISLRLSTLFYSNTLFQEGDKRSGFLNEAKEWAGELLSGQTKVNPTWWQNAKYSLIIQAGKVMNGVVFVISICSQLTYFYDAQTGLVEKCITEYPATLKVKLIL